MKLALWQTRPQASIETALEALSRAAQKAASQSADLLVTPEMYLGGYNIGANQIATHAEQSELMLDTLKTIAQTCDLALVVGLPLPGDPRPYNGCVAVSKAGQEVARYHKTHLFGDVDRTQFAAGETLSAVFDLEGWKVALAICYDVEFPELTRTLALRGAEVILCPTANMTPFDSVANRLVPARAEENAIYLAYCNYIGAEAQFAYNGLSCVAGPHGNDLVRGRGTDVMLFARLDREALTLARKAQTHLTDRRPDLYGDLI